jgi:aspartate/methionine/tyrosine aminotransferase
MPQLAATVSSTPHSGIRRVAELARRLPDAVRLDLGDPSFDTPAHICDAAFAAMHAGDTRYTPSGGFPSLRSALADKVRSQNGFAPEPEQIVATAGGCGGLFTTLLTLLDPGDEVLLPDPGWPNFRAMVHVLNGRSVGYPVDLADGTVDAAAVEELITERTKVLLVNSPGNPTGAVLDADALAALADVAERHDLWLLSDECYDQLVFDVPHTSMATVASPERTITVFSFSKTYAMTGWRLGYVVGPRHLADELVKSQEPVHGNASSISQRAAEAALSGDQAVVEEMRDAYRTRRDVAVDVLSRAGVRHSVPGGAFYTMVDVSSLGSSTDAATTLLEDEHVAVVPGSAFGPGGEGWARVSLCCSDETMRVGLERIVRRLGTARTATVEVAR